MAFIAVASPTPVIEAITHVILALNACILDLVDKKLVWFRAGRGYTSLPWADDVQVAPVPEFARKGLVTCTSIGTSR